ncbi:DNA/RNA helicase, superfamily II protein [Pseudomonas chlororaphis]|nr:DNA/RNA helicase, superfamily II protein [Pseudomonas chlororaphis]
MTQRTGSTSKRPSFADVKSAALKNIDRVLAHWLPHGKRVDGGKEYTAPNPTRTDKRAGSLKVSLSKGTWSDFATGDKGGDLIDLVRYIDGGTDVEACNKLAELLNVSAGTAKAKPAPAKPKALEWIAIQPIPSEAMSKCPAKHRQHGAPSKVWIYRDAQGQPVMALYRFDLGPDEDGKPRKVFAPLTWCKRSDGQTTQWRWQGLPEPRPLLRLDELAQRADAPVVLCEGEKAADAAAELMPGYVATCWPNGSNSWHKADLLPLKGRSVLLWPDNDASGKACMDAIEPKLLELGAESVQRVALEAFKRKPTTKDGKPSFAKGGKWVDGDDAADALSKGWTAGHVAELVSSGELFELPGEKSAAESTEAKPEPKTKAAAKRPAKSKNDLMPGGFRLTPEGVFYSGDDGEARPVCSPLEIIARTRDEKGHNWGLLVEFDDPDGAKKRWNIPARTMTGDFGKDVLGPLVDMGLRLAGSRSGRNARNDLQSYLGGFDSAQRARLVTRLGWHGNAFLLPEQQIGSHEEHLHFYEAGAQLPPISEAGSLEQWQQQIGALCVGNHRLSFVVSVAFAGPLLNLLGHESGGFHFYGDSSGGKTTHLQVAASVYGGPRLVRSWRSTDNALESIAAAHSDGLLVLDEIGMCDARIIGETVYMLGNGTGKARANDRGQAGRQVQEWRLLFLSTGEKTLAQHMAEANKELKAGMEVRMLAVPADASKGLGMFDVLNGFEDAAALSDALKARVAKFYGTPLTAFLKALSEPGEMLRWSVIVRRTLEQFITQNLPATASGQAQRAALRFGLAAAAGELATAFGVTGWPDGTATTAARVCLHGWLAERGGAGNLEGEAIMARLRQVIERFGESRFTRWESTAAKIDEHGPRTIDRLGFRKTMEHGMGDTLHTTITYYVLPEAWRSEVFRGLNLTAVNRELIQRGVLQPAKDGKASCSVRLPGMGVQRCYVVLSEPGNEVALAETEAA